MARSWVACSLAFIGIVLSQFSFASGFSGNRADYIIVGVGTAGAVLAKRLSDNKKNSVIALHAGENLTDSFILKYGKNTIFSVGASLLGSPLPFNPMDLDLPPEIQHELQNLINLTSNAAKPLYETGATIPQVCASGEDLLWVVSQPEGGGSSVNAGAWCIGTKQVYSQWEAIGGPEWSVKRILKTFKSLENYKGETPNESMRGKDGPLEVIQTAPSELAKTFTKAIIKGTGVPFVVDYNDQDTPIGVSQFQLTRKGEQGFYRVSSVSAFLKKDVMDEDGNGVDGRKLKVKTGCTALRVIWDGNKAIGVQYLKNGKVKQAFAAQGVIVCAGLKSSPFLLNSGVGPGAFLESLGIDVVYDNPNVGKCLADQPHIILLFSSNPEDSGANGNTPFSQLAWFKDPRGARKGRQLRLATADVIPGLTLGLFDLVQPLSRGSVSISTSNPLDPPIVDFGLLCNEDDLDLYVAGFQTYIKNINEQLKKLDPLYQLIVPDPSLLEPENEVFLKTFIESSAESNMHFQSHCRMGPPPPAGFGVVDSHCRVYGVKNLYVCDNSINPQCMDGSPMATGYLNAANLAKILGH